MPEQAKVLRINRQLAIRTWGKLSRTALKGLDELIGKYSLSVASGDILYLSGRWYVTHSGLLRVAHQNRCAGVSIQPVAEFSDAAKCRWAFKATVYKSRTCKGFVGYGDADPSNVSLLVRGAEMRIAETRAVNRALRKAYGIGICSVEEFGSSPPPKPPRRETTANTQSSNSNGRSSSPLLRDRLNLLIRQHQLDPLLVKRYAADFCGTQALRDASRELVEDFVATLSKKAHEDLSGLKCQLNGYHNKEVRL